jgi:RNA polymerase sigma-70 factor (ECF subfamily)
MAGNPIDPGMPTPKESFPWTHWSIISRARSGPEDSDERRAALEELAKLYWKPVYAYLRLRWRLPPNEALDLSQDFFLDILEGKYLPSADVERGRFRTFLKACLDNHVRGERRKDRAQVRGGDRARLSIDAGEDPDRFLIARETDSPEEILDRHWRMAVLEEALRKLEAMYRQEKREIYFEVLKRHDLLSKEEERPTYEKIAEELKVSRSDVDNYLRHARKTLLEKIKEILSMGVQGAEELAAEMKEFSADSPWSG